MHYKHKRNAKVHSGSFFLFQEILEKLDFIANFEAQSRSVIVERAIIFSLKGNKNGWDKSKAIYKKKKKISITQRSFKKNRQRIQEAKNKQKCLFDYGTK